MNLPGNFTTDPLSVATAVNIEPEFMRLPKYKQHDPVFGLTRGTLNQLILPCKANNYRPPVRSCVLRKRGARTGVRLIDIASLREYIRRNQEPNSGLP